MLATRIRTVIASEHPDVRYLLLKVVEKEPGVVVIGQAENAVKAMALARSLRPDVALVDSQLPHTVGLDAVRLSRISGLDTAMDISQELPKTRVVLLANLNISVYQEYSLDEDAEAYLYTQTGAGGHPVRLREVYYEAAPTSGLVFANIQITERAPVRRKVIEISEKAMLYSGLAILGGLGLMLTLILAAPGAVLALAGAGGLLLGLAGRVAAAVWPKRRPVAQESNSAEATKLEAA